MHYVKSLSVAKLLTLYGATLLDYNAVSVDDAKRHDLYTNSLNTK